jgi:cytochrome oxidase Cu insertion factor (SCO1/SenC/PrrC family)
VACLLASNLLQAQAAIHCEPGATGLDRVVMLESRPGQSPSSSSRIRMGRPFSSSSLRGRPALVFFGYAHCPRCCPAALAKLKMLQSQGA